jgi:hypothetical protein
MEADILLSQSGKEHMYVVFQLDPFNKRPDSVDWIPNPHLHWSPHSPPNGRSQQDGKNGRNEGYGAATPVMESRNIWPLGYTQNRPYDHASFPDVFHFKLVLHVA